MGAEVISEARVAMPAATPLIPPGSRVTLPDPFGGRTAEVLAEQFAPRRSRVDPELLLDRPT